MFHKALSNILLEEKGRHGIAGFSKSESGYVERLCVSRGFSNLRTERERT